MKPQKDDNIYFAAWQNNRSLPKVLTYLMRKLNNNEDYCKVCLELLSALVKDKNILLSR